MFERLMGSHLLLVCACSPVAEDLAKNSSVMSETINKLIPASSGKAEKT